MDREQPDALARLVWIKRSRRAALGTKRPVAPRRLAKWILLCHTS